MDRVNTKVSNEEIEAQMLKIVSLIQTMLWKFRLGEVMFCCSYTPHNECEFTRLKHYCSSELHLHC